MTDDSLNELWIRRARKRRRFRIVAAAAAALLILGYWLSPYVAAARFAAMAQEGDAEAVLLRTDLPALQRSFARQIVRAYLASNPRTRDLDPLSRQAASGVAAGYVGAIIADHLTPAAIAALLAGRRTGTGGVFPPGGGLTPIDGFGRAWALFRSAGFTGPASFAVEAPIAGEPYRLHFTLSGTSWLLSAIDLPAAVLERLAGELKARTERSP